MSPELLHYIEQARKAGLTNEIIRTNLVNAGWDAVHVDAVLGNTVPVQVPVPQPLQSPVQPIVSSIPASAAQPSQAHAQPQSMQGSASMWDAFEHILLFISLYITATSATLLLHAIIDWKIPSPVDQGMYASDISYVDSWYRSMMRGYVSSLIVAYPVFAILFLRITKHTQEHPALRFLRSRRILIYITLIVTFIIMLVKLGMTVFTLMEGNLSMNFVLHVLLTILVNALLFTYYYRQVREDRRIATTP